jgi:opacity protein-like surface antigen
MRHLVLAALTLALAAPAAALDERLDLRVGGGAIVPFGSTTDHFETGWQITGGMGWAFGETLGLRVDYSYSDERLIGHALSQGFVNGSHVMHGLEAGVRWTLTPEGPAPIYLLGGLGLYRQETAITAIRDYVPGPSICNPWLQVCAVGPVPADEILGSRTSTDPGLNLGAGVEVPIRGRVRFVFEVRWRLVRGDAFGLPGQGTSRAWGNYFPVTLAVRF